MIDDGRIDKSCQNHSQNHPPPKIWEPILANMLSCSTHFNHQQIIKKSWPNHTKTHTNHNQITEIKQKCRERWEQVLINSIKALWCPGFFYSISRLETYFCSLNYPISLLQEAHGSVRFGSCRCRFWFRRFWFGL